MDELGPPTIPSKSRPRWTTALVLTLVVFLAAARYYETAKLVDPHPVLVMIALSTAYGAGLAISRFRPRIACLANLAMSLGAGGIVMGQVLPGLSYIISHPFMNTLRLMNAQAFILFEQFHDGGEQLLSGALPRGLLAGPVFGLAAWHTMTWLIWSVARRGRAWTGVLACLGLLLVDDVLALREPSWPMGLAIAGVLMIAHTAYIRKIVSWDRTRVGYPDLIPESWAVGAAGIALVVVFATGLSTPEWRDSIQDFLDSLRPPPSEPAAAAPVPRAAAQGASYAQSFVPTLDTIGSAFASGNETVFYVTTSDLPTWADTKGAMGPPSQQHYWRGAVFDRYTGTGWEMASVGETERLTETRQEPSPGRYVLKQRFKILALPDDRLFAVNQAVAATNGVQLRVISGDGITGLPRGTAPEYGVTSWASRVTWAELSLDHAEYPDAIREVYLQVPEGLPQRVRSLAARITLGSRSAYEKADHIQEYLRSTYTYRLDVPAPPAGRDAVDYFLFDARAGFCSYYASAMAIMLRTQGVPARVATGFATGVWDGVAGRYIVPASAAHSWVEIYFPSYGWIEFEPTPARSAFDYAAPERLRPDTAFAASLLGRAASNLGLGEIRAGTILGLVVAVGAAALILRRRPWRRPGHDRRLRSLYWHMRRRLAFHRREAQGNMTPGEYLSENAEWLAMLPRLDRAVRQVTSLYIQTAYSPHGPSPAEVLAVQSAWRATWRERLFLRWRRAQARRGLGHGADESGHSPTKRIKG
jgi:hypothetical protein